MSRVSRISLCRPPSAWQYALSHALKALNCRARTFELTFMSSISASNDVNASTEMQMMIDLCRSRRPSQPFVLDNACCPIKAY
jgi:hypothetical protein